MNLINNTGTVPSGKEEPKEFLTDEACFLKMFELQANLCFDSQLKDRLDRFTGKYSKLQIGEYKVLRFTLLQKENHFLNRIVIDLAKFVYNDDTLRKLVHKLNPNNNTAYDIYTDYFERLGQKNPILIVISNFFEEAINVSDDELAYFNMMIEKCGNVRVWICGEDKKMTNRHSPYLDFYKQFDPIPLNFFESMQSGGTLPYAYFSYNWEGKSNNTVDKLCDMARMNRIPHKRDKEDCGYRSDIHEFMNQIRKGQHIIVFLGKKYLKSFYCMYELTGILDYSGYESRIYPVIVDTSIREDGFEDELKKYWKSKLRDRIYQDALKDRTVTRFTLKRKAELMKDYISKIPKIVDYIARIDGHSLKDMEAQNFAPLMGWLSRNITVRL